MKFPFLGANKEDIVDVKQQSLKARLRQLFSSDVIVRNVGGKQLKIKDTDNIMAATDKNSLRDRFNRIRSTSYNAYTRDFALSYQAARMDLFRDYDCVGPDTIIPLPDGTTPTIAELTEKYKDNPQERFLVFSYDHETDSIKLGKAYHPRKKKGKRQGYKVIFDDGSFIIGSLKHPFLMRDGSKKRLFELRVGDSVMPFYQKEGKVYQPNIDGYKEFHYKKCPNCSEMFGFFDRRPSKFCSRKCYAEYRSKYYIKENCPSYRGKTSICLECGSEFKYKKSKKYCSKECSIKSHSNGPSILETRICNRCNIKFGVTPKNKNSKYCSDKCRIDVFITSFKGENHYAYLGGRKSDIRKPYLKSSGWKDLCEKIRKDYDYTCMECAKTEKELNETLSVHHILSPRLFENPIDANNKKNLIPLCRKCHTQCPDHKSLREILKSDFKKILHEHAEKIIENVSFSSKFLYSERFDSNLEEKKIFEQFISNLAEKKELSSNYNQSGFKNHKIVSIEMVGEIDVYDVTVEKYANFATDSCIVGNTMDMDPIIASALDIYSDECLTQNELGKVLTVHSKNNNVKEILENLFYDILNIQHNLWSWTRNMCKYGDFFLKLYITPEYGVYMVDPISAYNVERIEGSDPYNKRYVKFQIRPTDTFQAEVCENYEIAHFRLMSDSNFLPYGKSIVEGARRVWKQLSLMEDAMLIHRIMRAPEKRIFYTDVGTIPPNEVETYMLRMQNMMKKVPYVDEMTGEYNLRFNLQNMVEDYYIPVRGGDSGTKIDTLGGMSWTGTEDIEYLRNKMMAALKIPKAFLGYEEGISGKATLASEDVRFARTIQRVQRILTSELTKIAIVHLYAQGYRDESLVDFDLELTNPSTIFEREKIEIWSDKVSVAADMMETKLFSKDWIYKNIFNLSEDDVRTVKDEVIEDIKQNYRFSSIEEEGNDPAKPFSKIKGGSGGGGNDMGGIGGGIGGMGGDLEDMGGEETPPEEGEEIPPEPSGEDEEEVVKEIAQPRDQSGEHKATDHLFGEDPLGAHELYSKPKKNSEGKKKSPLRHNFEDNTPLALKEYKKQTIDQTLFLSLEKMETLTNKDIKTELISENEKLGLKKSMMDESNILDE